MNKDLNIDPMKKREIFCMMITVFVIAFIFVVYVVLLPAGYLSENSKIFIPNWYSGLNVFVTMEIWSFIGVPAIISLSAFIDIVFGISSLDLFPGILFFILIWISIPLMLWNMKGMKIWKQVLYSYLVAMQLSILPLVFWIGISHPL
ncbi:hypothetical protein [Nitrosopumilus sp.]|uniref:hypothetical protein n=1 Tax=Nitrosopumilus sp. TaxID=2024843 RepID=UPI0034A058FA